MHKHHHTHHVNKAFIIAIVLTIIYIIAEVMSSFIANSMSLLADALHNLGDALGLFLAALANWLLTFPPKKRYSYGFKRTTIIAALLNACILIATSSVIAVEAIYKLLHLSVVNEPIVMLIGILGIIINGGSALLFIRDAHHDLNIKGAFLHLLADALILVGVVLSAIIIYYTKWYWVDPVVGLIIILIVLYGTWGLLRDSVNMMLDAIPHHIDQTAVKNYLLNYPGVKTVHDLHIWGLSTRETALTVHLIMPETILTDHDYKKINIILHEKFNIQHATIQVETGKQNHPCKRSTVC